ncbi:MAG TPA: hypothetical protein VEY93_14390 [Longimicrobium sp.]|nr:hypothetical protein [Longimicrobium sp.]
MRRTALLFAAPFALALAACEGGATDPAIDASLSEAEARELASAWDAVAAGAIAGVGPMFSVQEAGGPSAAATTTSASFKRQHACPAGGGSTIEGTRVLTRDPATRTGSMQVSATRTDSACTIPARGQREGTVTITGSPNIVLAANHSWTNGVPGVHTHTQKGGFTWSRSTGGTGTCTVDLTGTFTPATQTYTLTGTFCGRTVNVTHTRTS